jgi:hypothetical protein
MEIKVDVNLHAPELVKAIEKLTSTVPVKKESVATKTIPSKEIQKSAEASEEVVSKTATKKAITLDRGKSKTCSFDSKWEASRGKGFNQKAWW